MIPPPELGGFSEPPEVSAKTLEEGGRLSASMGY